LSSRAQAATQAGDMGKAMMQTQSRGSRFTAHVQRRVSLTYAFRSGSLPVAAALMAVALLTGPLPGHAAMYKWVDEKGVVHYSDQLPPEAINKNRVELNPQGIPINKTERPATPEQLRAKEQDEARARQVERQQEEIARRDRALVASYTTEKDIDLARDRALRTIEAVVQSAEAYAMQLKARGAEAEAKKASFAGKPVPPALERELESIASETARQTDLVARKKKEAEAVKAKYDADKQRWRELVAAKTAADAQTTAAVPVAPARPAGAAPAQPGAKK
jgi:hypothetical protein